MVPTDIRIAPCPAPEGIRFPDLSLWWAAYVEGEVAAKMGAFPWELDNSLCITQEPNESCAFIEVLSELLDEILRYSVRAGYSGVYAITYKLDPALPNILEKLAFEEIGQGRDWSDNPTTFWYRETST